MSSHIVAVVADTPMTTELPTGYNALVSHELLRTARRAGALVLPSAAPTVLCGSQGYFLPA